MQMVNPMRLSGMGFLLAVSFLGVLGVAITGLVSGGGSAKNAGAPQEAGRDLSSAGRVLKHAPSPVVDSGKFVIAHDFPIENDLDRPICFTKVRSSCGCSKAKLGTTRLQPGEKTTLHVEVAFGKQGGTRRVSSLLENDVEEPWLCILDAKAYPWLQFEKDLNHTSFGTLEPGEGATKSIEMHTHARVGGTPPVVSAVKARSEEVEVSVLDCGDVAHPDRVPTRRFLLTLRLAPQYKSGNHTSGVDVTYEGHQVRGKEKLTLAWEVRNIYEVSPKRIHAVFARADPIEKTVTVRRADGRHLRVLGVSSSCPQIDARRLQSGASDQQQVLVCIHPRGDREALYGEILITTDDPVQPEIRLAASAVSSQSF